MMMANGKENKPLQQQQPCLAAAGTDCKKGKMKKAGKEGETKKEG